MTTLREAAEMPKKATPHKQLIDELLDSRIPKTEREHAAAREIERLRDALAQPEPEPVAWMTINPYGEEDDISYEDPTMDLLDGWTCKPLYTQPPQREWIGLTDAELEEFSNMQLGSYDLCDAVEERLEEKNRG